MTTPAPPSMRERLREDYAWTPRQREVLDMLANGKTNGEIADRLGVSLAGAKWHVSEIMSKLGADSREEAAEYWRLYNGFRPRFARVFRAVAVPAAVKWVAAGGGLLVAAAGVAALIVTLQGGEPASTDGQSASPTSLPTAIPTAGGDNRTGIAGVDAVIDAVLSREHDRVIALLELAPVPCSAGETVPIAPKCDATDEGTLVDAFPISGCESGWTGPQFPWVDSLLMREPTVLGVFRQGSMPASPPDTFPRGEYVVLWQYSALGGGGVALEVTDGRIVRETAACGPYPYSLTKEVDASDFVLLPATGVPTPPPTPQVRHLGDPANDGLIDAMIAGDWRTLANAFELFPEPCTTATERGVGSPPACPPGVEDGGAVFTTRITACEGVRSTDPLYTMEQIGTPMFAFGHELYAAFRPDRTEYPGGIPGGELVVVLRPIGSTAGSAWHLADGKIVGLRLGCGDSAADFVEDVPTSSFQLPPLP